VLIPIVTVMFFVGVFRFYLTQYLSNHKTPEKATKTAIKDHASKNIVAMCTKLMGANVLLSDNSFRLRKSFFCKKPNGVLYGLSSTANATGLPTNMMMNPSAMTGMLQNNLSMAVSTMLQFAWISFFFSGFVLSKVPFPLTQKFRSMLQKGVEIQNLDVRYVSSLSLYFLILFGLNGLQNLILTRGEEEEEFTKNVELENMKNPMGAAMGGGGAGQPPDYAKLFTAERENLELIKHNFALPAYENIAIQRLKAGLDE